MASKAMQTDGRFAVAAERQDVTLMLIVHLCEVTAD